MAHLICKRCGQPITTHAITALGATWHPEHFVCAVCGKPFPDNSFIAHNGSPYHEACYQNRFAPRCAYCNRPLTDKYITSLGKSYHEECYREQVAPRCGYCGEPLTDKYINSSGKSYHEECYREHVVPRCVYCNKPLTDRYHIDYWGNKFCIEHEQKLPKCAFCGRLVPPQQQELGRKSTDVVRCPICRQSAVESINQAQKAFGEVMQWAETQSLRFAYRTIPLELVDHPTLTTASSKTGTDALGVTKSTAYSTNGQVTNIQVEKVVLLRGMPLLLFKGVAAHELGHVWLVMNAIPGLPAWAEEGFCELLAHRFYSEIGSKESSYHLTNIEKNADSTYGEGFRRVRAIADSMGFARFVEELRRTKKMPK